MNELAALDLLIVEDNPGDAALIQELLSEKVASPPRITQATTLAAGLEWLAGHDGPPGHRPLVLLDLGLPDGQGLDVLGRALEAARGIPVVVLTGNDDEDLALACVQSGAQDYLCKGDVRRGPLRRAIAHALSRAREQEAERTAEKLKEHLAAIVESTSDAIFGLDFAGVVQTWNSGAARMFEIPIDAALGRPIAELLPSGSDDPPWAELESGVAVERSFLVPSGRTVEASVVLTDVGVQDGAATARAAIVRDITALKRWTQELEARDQLMSALTRRLNDVREEERAHIAREIHDELGQLLTGIRMELRWIERHTEAGPDTKPGDLKERFERSVGIVDRTLLAVQRIAVELRPSALDVLGLVPAVRDEARRFEAQTGVPHHVDAQASARPSDAIATTLFRVLQELLVNVARHARARAVQIYVEETPEHWKLRVEDDGVGIPSGASSWPTSLGLLGIQERLAHLRGRFEISPRAPAGTLASVEIPKGAGVEGP